MSESSSIPTLKLPQSSDMVPTDHNLSRILSTLKLWHPMANDKLNKGFNIHVSGKDGRKYMGFAQEASRAGRGNEIILTSVIAYVIMSGWPGTALHEQRVRDIQEDHRNMLKHNTPLSYSICANYKVVKDDVDRFSIDESLSFNQRVLRIQDFIERIKFHVPFVTITKDRLLMIAHNLLSAWSRFPTVPNVSSAEDTDPGAGDNHGSIESYRKELDRLRNTGNSLPFRDAIFSGTVNLEDLDQQSKNLRRPDSTMLVDFHGNISILTRVWDWVSVDLQQITMWFETAADMVAFPFYMQVCLDRGMDIYAEMSFYLRQYGDVMSHWLEWPV